MSAPLARRHSAGRAEPGRDSVSPPSAELAGIWRGRRGRHQAVAHINTPGPVEALDHIGDPPLGSVSSVLLSLGTDRITELVGEDIFTELTQSRPVRVDIRGPSLYPPTVLLLSSSPETRRDASCNTRTDSGSARPPRVVGGCSDRDDPTSTGPRESDGGGGGNWSDQGERTIELVEASTEVVIQRGGAVTIGGSEQSGEVLRQFLIGYERTNPTGQATLMLIAESP